MLWCHITEMLHKHKSISNHLQLDCLLNSLFQLATKKTPCITDPLLGESTYDNGFPSHRASNGISVFVCYDIIIESVPLLFINPVLRCNFLPLARLHTHGNSHRRWRACLQRRQVVPLASLEEWPSWFYSYGWPLRPIYRYTHSSSLKTKNRHDANFVFTRTGLILGLRSANERRRCFATMSLICLAQA